MKITAIEQQKKNTRRYSLFLDGEFALGIDEGILLKAGLRIGDTISEDEVERLRTEDERFRAREAAFRLLKYRQRSVAEMRERLGEKGFLSAVIEEVIEDLLAEGYLDDTEFATLFAEDLLTRKNIGPLRLRAELNKKQVPDRIINTTIEQMYRKYDEQDLARQAASKKMATLRRVDKETAYRRLTGYLARRGFHWDVINEVIPTELSE